MSRVFVKRLFLFLIPIVAGYMLLEMKLAYIPNSYNQKRAFFEKQEENIQVLLTGPSYILYGADPSCLSHRAFNIANTNQSIYYDTRLVRKYADSMKQLKMVIMDLSYFSFYTQLYHTQEEWRDYFYARFWGIRYKDLPYTDARNYSLFALYTSKEVTNALVHHFNVSYADGMHPDGFIPLDTANNSAEINDSSGLIHVRQQEKSFMPGCVADNIKDLGNLIEYLQNRHIQVVFITTPVYNTFSKYCNPEVLAMNSTIANDLFSRYHCTYHNYFTDKRFVISDFHDNDHLNRTGAIKLSHIIDHDIIAPAFAP